jgi:hypothetical protein
MTKRLLRSALALGFVSVFALGATDMADARERRSAYKKPRPPALVERPYEREPGCHTMYDSSRTPLPDYMNPNCENAFRRLYPPR